jgi:DNA helicase-2/ATP-dependent DNA helicase PcrA
MSFSFEQEMAIEHEKGPMLVLAGPGSGKTTVITERLRRLIEKGVPGDRILVITFTRAAAEEMETRFLKAVRVKNNIKHHTDVKAALQTSELKASDLKSAGDKAIGIKETASRVDITRDQKAIAELSAQRLPVFGTFHSIFFHILKLRYQLDFRNIITEREKALTLREYAEREKLDTQDTDFLRLLIGEISRYKSMADPESFQSEIMDTAQFHRILLGYKGSLKARRLLDFDDMLTMCLALFCKQPEELRLWQKRFQYILVDEFQDISPVQYEVIRKLALPENNLFIVGDDDQSIYRFRGAEPAIMLGFQKDYPDAKRVVLSRNFRSHAEIVAFASRVIRHNTQRFPKDIVAARGNGGKALCFTTETASQEYAFLVRSIQNEIKSGLLPEQIAVLYRSSIQIRPLVEELNRSQVPYILREHVPDLYEHFIARDMLAYLKLAAGRGTRGDLIRIMNRPLRYLSRDAVQGRSIRIQDMLEFYKDRPWMQQRVRAFMEELNVLRRLPTAGALVYLRKKIGYEEWLRGYAGEHHTSYDALQEVMEEIEASALKYPDKLAWIRFTERFGEELRTAEQKRSIQQGVRLMTFHASKGLEFDTVHLIDAVEGITPFAKAKTKEELEEERREFYVAVTRARREIHIYVTKQRYSKKCSPSRFLLEGMHKKCCSSPGVT